MDILKPPTDNLYKFCAISGVIIVLLSFYPFYQTGLLYLRIIEHRGQIKIVEEKAKRITEENELIKQEMEAIKKDAEMLDADQKKIK